MVITDADREMLDGKTYNMTGMVMEDNFNRNTDFSNVYLFFDLNNNRVSGRDGCNNISGKIKVDSGKIEFLPMASTRMMCENIETYSSFHKNLNFVSNFKISDNMLKFYKTDELLMEFEIQK